MGEDALERRRGILALEAPPRRFPGWKRVLAIAELPRGRAARRRDFPGRNRMKEFVAVLVVTGLVMGGLGAVLWWAPEVWEALL